MKGRLIIDTWDNGGKTVDRHTIAISGIQQIKNEDYTIIISSSSNPFHPQGVWQHSNEIKTDDFYDMSDCCFGNHIKFWLLPSDVKRAVYEEIALI